MPIDLAYPADALPPHIASDVLEQLTGVLLRNEGAPDNESTRAMSWSLLHPMPPGAMNVGGRPADRPIYRVIATVPAGTLLHGPGPLAEAARQGLVRELTSIVLEAEGAEEDDVNSLRVMVVIHEVPEGSWGGLGTTFGIKDIAALADEGFAQTEPATRARRALAQARHGMEEAPCAEL